MCHLWYKNRDIFIVYIGLNIAQIYPFGHSGIIGWRLSLYMSVFFYMPCVFGMEFIYARFRKKICGFRLTLSLFLLIILSFYRDCANLYLISPPHTANT